MPNWRSQLYKKQGKERGHPDNVLNNAIATVELLHNHSNRLPPVLSLKHLSVLSDVSYQFLRDLVAREGPESYRLFRIRKYPLPGEGNRYRSIAVPEPPLMQVQRWIDRNILANAQADKSSVAFSSGDSIITAASHHCGARWLVKLDIKSFFESISERQVYRVFVNMRYQPLVAFEMARICTRVRTGITRSMRWYTWSPHWNTISAYHATEQGYLPQGAPTSPRLSNLAVVDFDKSLRQIAKRQGLIYTRYADDLCFSTTSSDFSRKDASQLIGKVYKIMGSIGFSPNKTKTHIASPRSRKVILGLLVDRDQPRLTREFKLRIRQHLHYLTHPDFGPARHAQANCSASIYGLRNHVRGLLAFAASVEPDYADNQMRLFETIKWP